MNIARSLHSIHNVPIKELAVLTPYSKQKEVIKRIAQQRNLGELLVATINESQGMLFKHIHFFFKFLLLIFIFEGNEFGIVILSTVRSQPLAKIRNKEIIQPDDYWIKENLGFITDKHQINVGITRSKYGLIITGMIRCVQMVLQNYCTHFVVSIHE